MRFVIFSMDKTGSLDIRKANREAHLAFLKSDKAVAVQSAGPWLNDEGYMAGSVLIVECEDRIVLDAWMARDPYALAGLPDNVIIKPFVWAIGAPQ